MTTSSYAKPFPRLDPVAASVRRRRAMSGNAIEGRGSEAGIKGASLFHGDAHLAGWGVHGQSAVDRVAESSKTGVVSTS
jgi:hypothetical protein